MSVRDLHPSSYETNIEISRYRTFAAKNPTRISYFQPILNAIEYAPGSLEFIDNAVFVEGKNDFYTIQYFNEIILKNCEAIAILPGTTASGFDTLISLYLGWRKRFILLLDDDAEGRKNRKKYIDEWYLPETQVLTLADISTSWLNFELEDLFEEQDIIGLKNQFYPEKAKNILTKKEIARALQEKLICRDSTGISQKSKAAFKKLIDALRKQLNTYSDP